LPYRPSSTSHGTPARSPSTSALDVEPSPRPSSPLSPRRAHALDDAGASASLTPLVDEPRHTSALDEHQRPRRRAVAAALVAVEPSTSPRPRRRRRFGFPNAPRRRATAHQRPPEPPARPQARRRRGPLRRSALHEPTPATTRALRRP